MFACPPVQGKHKRKNMAVMTSVGRDEMGANALRRCFNTWMDFSSDFISPSMACFRYSQEFALLGSMVKRQTMSIASRHVVLLPVWALLSSKTATQTPSRSYTRHKLGTIQSLYNT